MTGFFIAYRAALVIHMSEVTRKYRIHVKRLFQGLNVDPHTKLGFMIHKPSWGGGVEGWEYLAGTSYGLTNI